MIQVFTGFSLCSLLFRGMLLVVTAEGVTPFPNCQLVTSGVWRKFPSFKFQLPQLPIGSHPLTSFTNNAPQCFWKAAIYMTLKWDHTLTLGRWIILELLSQRSTNNNSSERIFKSFTHAVCFVFSGFVLQQKRHSSVSRTRKKNKITCAFFIIISLDVACSPLNAHHTYIIIHGAAINSASSHDDT